MEVHGGGGTEQAAFWQCGCDSAEVQLEGLIVGVDAAAPSPAHPSYIG